MHDALAARACVERVRVLHGHSDGKPSGFGRLRPTRTRSRFLPLASAAIVGGIAGLAGVGYATFALLHVHWAFAVAWAAAIGLTGAIHVDGFLDSCDGLLVAAPPPRRLEIMKDPRHGTFAVVGFAVLVVFWLLAMAPIPPERLPLLLAWSGALSRLAVVPNAWAFPYARAGAMSATFATRPSYVLFVAVVRHGWKRWRGSSRRWLCWSRRLGDRPGARPAAFWALAPPRRRPHR